MQENFASDVRDISQHDHKIHWVKTLSFKNVRRKHLRPLIFLMNQQTFSARGLHRKNGHRWSVSLDLTKSHEGIFKLKNAIRLLSLSCIHASFSSAALFLVNFCCFLSAKYFERCYKYKWHKGCHNKVCFFHSGGVKLSQKNMKFVVVREE